MLNKFEQKFSKLIISNLIKIDHIGYYKLRFINTINLIRKDSNKKC